MKVTTPTNAILRDNKDTKNGSISYDNSNGLTDLINEFSASTTKLEADNTANGYCPIEVLPEKIRLLVEELSDKYKFPKEFSLLCVLFVTSVAAGNNFRARYKASWLEPALLYIAIVAKAGQTKTPVQNFLTKVLKKRNQRYYDEYSSQAAAWEEAKRAASKESPYNEPKPKRQQILIQDSTIEAMIKALDTNRRGLGASHDELSGFFGNMNKYNGGNEWAFYLSTYNTQPYSSNRKTTEDIYLPDPYLSIFGGIQPAILQKAFSDEMQDNGAKDRFIFCYPENLKKEVAEDEEIDESLVDHYTMSIEYLMDKGDMELNKRKQYEKDTDYIIVDFTKEAYQLITEYRKTTAEQVNQFNDDGQERLAGTFSKFDYHVIRLSFLVQLLTDAGNRELTEIITEDSAKKGIALADYFKWNAKRVHSLISGDPLASLDAEKRDFYNSLPDKEFPLSDALEIAKEIRSQDNIKDDAIEKWAKRFLSSHYFSKPKHGIYLKKII